MTSWAGERRTGDTMVGMESDEPAVSPRRAAAAAWLSAVLTLVWVGVCLNGFDAGWAVAAGGGVALAAFGLPLAFRRSTRDLGTGLCVGAVAGLIVAALVDLAV